jgi:inner membrane protein involved in colicin E2 resistance
MEMVTEPDTYSPGINETSTYIDKIPSFNNMKHGLRCLCGSRKDKVYQTHNIFLQHTKTKIHQKWLADLNTNRANYYVENENLKITLQNQRIIIAKMDKELQGKNLTIDYLTQQLVQYTNKNMKIGNLLEFD